MPCEGFDFFVELCEPSSCEPSLVSSPLFALQCELPRSHDHDTRPKNTSSATWHELVAEDFFSEGDGPQHREDLEDILERLRAMAWRRGSDSSFSMTQPTCWEYRKSGVVRPMDQFDGERAHCVLH